MGGGVGSRCRGNTLSPNPHQVPNEGVSDTYSFYCAGICREALAGTWVQGPLHIIDCQGKHSQLIGEPYTYLNLLSHKFYQLNAL